MITCPHCKKQFRLTLPKWSDEKKKKHRTANAWKYTDEILKNYNDGWAIMWLAKEYKSNKLIIRKILIEKGITEFRGRKGIKAWNEGLNQFTDKRVAKWSGKNNPNWKGGISPLMVKIRRCSQYRNWRTSIFTRDNYICQMCKKRGRDLQADHYPKMFCDVIKDNKIDTFEKAHLCKELWDLNNGRTLCKKCHQTTFVFKGNQTIQIK